MLALESPTVGMDMQRMETGRTAASNSSSVMARLSAGTARRAHVAIAAVEARGSSGMEGEARGGRTAARGRQAGRQAGALVAEAEQAVVGGSGNSPARIDSKCEVRGVARVAVGAGSRAVLHGRGEQRGNVVSAACSQCLGGPRPQDRGGC